MRVVMTVRELSARSLWADVCQMRGWEEMDTGTLIECCESEVTLSEEEAQRLGLIKVEVE